MEILDTVVHIAPLIILEGDYLERFAQNSGFVSQHFCHHFKYLLAADFMGGGGGGGGGLENMLY